MTPIKGTRCVLFALTFLVLATNSASAADKSSAATTASPLSAEESLKHLKLAPGLGLEHAPLT